MTDNVEALPVVRVEQCDGSHEHPVVQRLREENRALRAGLDWKAAEIERLRAALTVARAYIKGLPIEEAVVIPPGDTIHEGTDLSRYPTLLRVMDAALGSSEQRHDT